RVAVTTVPQRRGVHCSRGHLAGTSTGAGQKGPPVTHLVRHLAFQGGMDTAREHYVSTFDFQRTCSLYLTYYRHGDTRARGMALVGLKHTYRSAGYEPPESELPDYLPLLLEFAAAEPESGKRLLVQCQAGLELLRRGLGACDSPYQHVVSAVCATLPAPGKRQRATISKLAAEGPPSEEVGLEPFAPPEAMEGTTR